MRHSLSSAACITTIAVALVVSQPAAEPQSPSSSSGSDGAISLFDGKSLHGWRGYKKPDATGTRWQVQDGALTLPPKDANTHGSGDIITMETFDRFDLSWEWKVSPGGNSGLKYFLLEDRNSAVGHEYQIIDDARHADAKIGPHRQTAALYDVLPASDRPVKPAGEWNTSRIRVAPRGAAPGGTRVSHSLNGVRTLEYELGSPELAAAIQKSKFKDVARFGTLQKGHILLQDHGDQVWYRNIRIVRLAGS